MTQFADLPPEFMEYETADIVIVSAPYDETSTWIKGADKGPDAILEASAQLELYDIETDTEVYRRGIYTDASVDCPPQPEQMVNQVRTRIARHLEKDKFTVLLGGEHSVTIGAVQAHASRNPGLSVLQLDAHCDLRPQYLGSSYNHACAMARIQELCPFVQVGIRSMDIQEKSNLQSARLFLAEKIHVQTDWIARVAEQLSDHVYLTIDLDVFDPSIMPSTGTPEPGGLDWYTVMALLRHVAREKKIVGLDVVELCPNPANHAPDFLAAKLIYKLLSYIYANR